MSIFVPEVKVLICDETKCHSPRRRSIFATETQVPVIAVGAARPTTPAVYLTHIIYMKFVQRIYIYTYIYIYIYMYIEVFKETNIIYIYMYMYMYIYIYVYIKLHFFNMRHYYVNIVSCNCGVLSLGRLFAYSFGVLFIRVFLQLASDLHHRSRIREMHFRDLSYFWRSWFRFR